MSMMLCTAAKIRASALTILFCAPLDHWFPLSRPSVRRAVLLGAHGEGHHGLTAGGLGALIFNGNFQV